MLPWSIAALMTLLAAPSVATATCSVESTNSDVTNGIAGMPGRQDQAIRPGKQLRFEVRFQNRLGRTIDMKFATKDIGSSRTDPDQFIQIVEQAPYGAREWIKLDCGKLQLKHGDIAHVGVVASAPLDAEPGSYYAAVVGAPTTLPESGSGGNAAKAGINTAIGVQVFFDIPGTRRFEGAIFGAEAPHLVFKHRDTYVSIRGSYRNDGNMTDVVGGTTRLKSLFGNDVIELEMKPGVVLRAGSRQYRALWSDPPWIGRFTPVIELKRSNGTKVTKRLQPIWIIPSIWYILAVLGALSLPVLWRIYDRRKTRRWMQEYVAAAAGEPAEALDDEDSDEDWDNG